MLKCSMQMISISRCIYDTCMEEMQILRRQSVPWQVSLGWASWASVPFIGGSVSPARRALAVFPLLLLYTAIGWLALIKG